MIHTDKVIVVEGKYDKIRLENIVDATIIPTDGFGIFNNKELLGLLRSLAEKRGLVILTDSDSAGFMIRSFLSGAIDNSLITNVYIPELSGKEKRKATPSAEGLLGVEGVADEVIINALKTAGIGEDCTVSPKRPITKADLYEIGLSGGPNSATLRKNLLKSLSLPIRISANRLPDILNMLYTYDEFIKIASEVI